MRIWRLLTAASLFGAGAVAVACSSSSSGGGGGAEAGTDATDDGGGEAAACTPVSTNVATFDSGTTSWACIQKACGPMGLAACAADCPCNNAIAGALMCVQTMGAAATQTCFVTAFSSAGMGSEVSTLVSCLTAQAGPCAGIVVDGGEGGVHEGGEAGNNEAGNNEAGNNEAGNNEAGNEGGNSEAGTEGGNG